MRSAGPIARRSLGAGLLLLGLLPFAPSAAATADAEHVMTMTAPRTGYVDIRLRKPFTVDALASEIAFDGSFGGWFMHRMGEKIDLGGGNAAGAYDIADVSPSGPGSAPHRLLIGFQNSELARGLYRVYVLGDGPVSVRLPVGEEHAARSIRTLSHTRARAATVELPVNEAGAVNDRTHVPIRIGQNSLTITTLYFHAEPGATVQDVQTCIKAEPEDGSCEGGGIAGQVLHAFDTYDFSLSYMYGPGVLTPGSYFTYHKATVAGVERVVGASLKLRLRGI
ncbi:MAG TPA: hypothetical protein VG318_16660 [Actinomycetota bacterium]|nr:hypothetical protein [Actinomycetota bacterium]